MKIGKIDVTVPMIAYTAGFVAAIVVLLAMWRRNSDIRYEAIARNTVYRGMYDDNGEAIQKALENCQSLVNANPGKSNVRLYLANLQYRQKQYPAAQKSFDDAANLASATPREKGMAFTGAGVSLFMTATKETQPKVAVAAEEFFKKALDADKNCIDAMVNMGLAELYKGGDGALGEADKWCTKALELESGANDKEPRALVPSIQAQEQLYVLKALLSARHGHNSEAVGYFDRVKAMRQPSTGAEANKRLAMLASVTEKDLEVAARKELLTKLEAEASKFGKDNISAYNALGIGFSLQKAEPDYATVAMVSSMRNLSKAMDADPKDLRAYYNMTAILENRLTDVAAKISSPITGLTGETVQLNKWLQGEKAVRFTSPEKVLIVELKKILSDEEALWKRFQDKGKLNPPDRVEAKLRQLVCLRRQMYLLEPEEEGMRAPLLLRANNLQKDLEGLDPENPVVHQAIGHFLLDKGDYLGAHKEFSKAAEKGLKSPELDRLVKGLGVKPEVSDIRPIPNHRFYGPRPLVGGTLKAISAGGVPKQATMKIDDAPVQAVLCGPLGLQFLFFPMEKDLKDGEHTVSISMSDSMNQPVEFPAFKFGLDKLPPKLNITPDLGAPVTSKQVFTITLEDRSGVDFGSLKITVRAASSKGKDVLLISEGRVKRTMMETNPPRKIGHPIDSDTFQISAGQDLQPGEYELNIVVADMMGNVLTEKKVFTVK